MIRAIDVALSAIDKKKKGETMDLKEIFDGFDPAKYEEEVKQRYGDTDAIESQ